MTSSLNHRISSAGTVFLLLFLLPPPRFSQTVKTNGSLQDGRSRPTIEQKVKGPAAGRETVNKSTRIPELENLIAELSAAPVEIASDALIRIAMSGRISNPAWKQEILEKAVELAPGAHHQVRRKFNRSLNRSVDTSENYLSHAFDRRLDALSLFARAIQPMLATEKQRARDLFINSSPKLPLPQLSCEDTLVYDVSEYYELLGAIAKASFSDEEVRQGARVRFVQTYIYSMTSPSQIGPVIKTILAVHTRRDELSLLTEDLIRQLDKLNLDDRSFTYAVQNEDLTRRLFQLKQTVEKRNIFLVKKLADAYRDYLIRNMNGTRCLENAVTEQAKLPIYVQEANDALFRGNQLTLDAVKQKDILGRANVNEFWKTSDAQRLLDLFKDLKFPAVEGGGDPQERESSDTDEESAPDQSRGVENKTDGFQTKLRQFLSALEAWNGTNENSELDFFNQQQILYQGLFELATTEPNRSQVLRSWIKSLSQAKVDKVSRIEWLWHITNLSDATRKLPMETREEILDLMIYSNNSALSTYGKLLKLNV